MQPQSSKLECPGGVPIRQYPGAAKDENKNKSASKKLDSSAETIPLKSALRKVSLSSTSEASGTSGQSTPTSKSKPHKTRHGVFVEQLFDDPRGVPEMTPLSGPPRHKRYGWRTPGSTATLDKSVPVVETEEVAPDQENEKPATITSGTASLGRSGERTSFRKLWRRKSSISGTLSTTETGN